MLLYYQKYGSFCMFAEVEIKKGMAPKTTETHAR